MAKEDRVFNKYLNESAFPEAVTLFKQSNDLVNNYPKYFLTLDYDNANIDGIQKLNVIDWLL